MKRVFLFLAVLCAIGIAPSARADERRRIVATVGMIADIVSQVAGNRATVTGIIGSGVDPHLYKPTRSDIATLSQADVVFYNGLLLEGKMTDALIRVATSGRKVFPVTELLEPAELLEPSEFQGQYDPHVWMDPTAWAKAVIVVRDKLSEFDPAGKDVYAANAEPYLKKLAALHEYAQQAVASIPKESRVLVTAHDAFNYFGRRYGFEVIGIQGMSTESEAGVQDIERIVHVLVKRKIGAVFIESTVSPRNVQALIEGAQAQGHQVRIGGELFSDAMGKPGSYEGTYIGMIDHNVTRIAAALGGKVDPKGMQGKLREPAPVEE